MSTKMRRQETAAISHPPTTGPIATAIPPRPDQAPIARPRSSDTKLASMIDRLPGTRRAPPAPWRARAAISTSRLGASAQSSDATLNQATPMRKIRRRPKMSPSDPPINMKADKVIRYDVSTHCSPATWAPKVRPIAGRATLTTVASNAAIPEPSTVANTTQRPGAVA